MPSFNWRRTSEYLFEIVCSRRNYAGNNFSCIAYGSISASTVVKNSGAHFVGSICVMFWGQNKMAAMITTTFVTPFLISKGVCFSLEGPIVDQSVLMQTIAWRRIGDKPLPEPVMAQFTDATWQHWASLCLNAWLNFQSLTTSKWWKR